MAKSEWPAWYSGPDGQTEIFESAGDVPAGWTSGAEKRKAGKLKKVEDAPADETSLDL